MKLNNFELDKLQTQLMAKNKMLEEALSETSFFDTFEVDDE